jgi:hypothetical protein
MSTVAFVFTQQLSDGISDFVRRVGGEPAVLVRELMRVYLETLYHWTAPPTRGNMGSRGGRKGGKAMVAGDIAAVMHPITPKYYDLLERSFGTEIVNKEFNYKGGGKYIIDQAKLIGADESSLNDYHQSRRRNNGRTDRPGAGLSGGGTGRWAPGRKGFARGDRPYARYVASAEKRVGKLKSGWEHPLSQVGSTMPHSWAKNAGQESGASGIAPAGSYREDLPEGTFGGSIEAENNVSYFRDDGFMRRGVEYIESWMQNESRIERWLDQMFAKHGVAR